MDGGSPCEPNSSLVGTRPTPKICFPEAVDDHAGRQRVVSDRRASAASVQPVERRSSAWQRRERGGDASADLVARVRKLPRIDVRPARDSASSRRIGVAAPISASLPSAEQLGVSCFQFGATL